jgi:hypothetical protein
MFPLTGLRHGGFAGCGGQGASADAAARAAPDPTQRSNIVPSGATAHVWAAELASRLHPSGCTVAQVTPASCAWSVLTGGEMLAAQHPEVAQAAFPGRLSHPAACHVASGMLVAREQAGPAAPGPGRPAPGPGRTGSRRGDSPPGGRGSGVAVAGAGPGRRLGSYPGPGPGAGCWVADLSSRPFHAPCAYGRVRGCIAS